MKKLRCASCGCEITRKKAERKFCIECLKRIIARDLIFNKQRERALYRKNRDRRMKGLYAQNFYDGIFPYYI